MTARVTAAASARAAAVAMATGSGSVAADDDDDHADIDFRAWTGACVTSSLANSASGVISQCKSCALELCKDAPDSVAAASTRAVIDKRWVAVRACTGDVKSSDSYIPESGADDKGISSDAPLKMREYESWSTMEALMRTPSSAVRLALLAGPEPGDKDSSATTSDEARCIERASRGASDTEESAGARDAEDATIATNAPGLVALPGLWTEQHAAAATDRLR
jgi:hypothetical protein